MRAAAYIIEEERVYSYQKHSLASREAHNSPALYFTHTLNSESNLSLICHASGTEVSKLVPFQSKFQVVGFSCRQSKYMVY